MEFDSRTKVPAHYLTKLALLCAMTAPLLLPSLSAEENKPYIVGDFEGSKSGWGYYGGSQASGYKCHNVNWLEFMDSKVLKSVSVSSSWRVAFSNG